MKEYVKRILIERNCDTTCISIKITKSALEIIYQFAEIHNLEFDVALELMVTMASSYPELYNRKSFAQDN